MKSFKDYLTENKKIYEFKVKIVGDCPKDCVAQIKTALAQFHVTGVSAGNRTPIQERHSDFPEHKNVQLTVFDVTTDYPANSVQIRERVATALGMTQSGVKVSTLGEEKEQDINHANDKRTNKAVGGTDYENSDNSDLVGAKYNMKFLQELGKEKHQGTQYKGVNDEILAASAPKPSKEKSVKQVETKTNFKNIFTKQVKLPKGAL
jgi:hypothetical protein